MPCTLRISDDAKLERQLYSYSESFNFIETVSSDFYYYYAKTKTPRVQKRRGPSEAVTVAT